MMPAPMMQGGPPPPPHQGVQGPPLHPPSLPPPQAPHPQQPQQHPNPAQQIDLKFDIVAKVKMQIRSLKESLANVMKAAGANIYHTAAGKSSEDAPQRIDKVLEEFFSICNQIEMNLKTIQECTMQQKEGAQYLPLPVVLGRSDTVANQSQDGVLSYVQYLSTVKSQVGFAKEVQDMLNEGARNILQVE